MNELFKRSGVGQSTLQIIVNGRSLNPKVQTLHKIAIVFNRIVAEFLDFSELNEFSFEDLEEGMLE